MITLCCVKKIQHVEKMVFAPKVDANAQKDSLEKNVKFKNSIVSFKDVMNKVIVIQRLDVVNVMQDLKTLIALWEMLKTVLPSWKIMKLPP